MSGSQPYCRGAGNHQWRFQTPLHLNAEFLPQLANYRTPRVFTWLYVSASGQPKLRVLVIDQEYMPLI